MDKAAAHLREHHLRVTDFRKDVLRAFWSSSTALSLNDLRDQLPSSTDRVTLYRTLQGFISSGMIHIIQNGNGDVKYALCTASCSSETHRDDHFHFSCRKCDQTWCLKDWRPSPLDHPSIGQTEEVHLHIKGICRACYSASSSS